MIKDKYKTRAKDWGEGHIKRKEIYVKSWEGLYYFFRKPFCFKNKVLNSKRNFCLGGVGIPHHRITNWVTLHEFCNCFRLKKKNLICEIRILLRNIFKNRNSYLLKYCCINALKRVQMLKVLFLIWLNKGLLKAMDKHY